MISYSKFSSLGIGQFEVAGMDNTALTATGKTMSVCRGVKCQRVTLSKNTSTSNREGGTYTQRPPAKKIPEEIALAERPSKAIPSKTGNAVGIYGG